MDIEMQEQRIPTYRQQGSESDLSDPTDDE